MKVVFSDRAYLSIITETSEKIETETGGIFLGCCENDTFYIVEAIDPGPESTFQVTYFEYDQKYTQHLINKIARIYDYKLTLVGLWHRHPGSFDQFSSTDDGTNKKYSQLSSVGAVSALINIDPKFRITVYHVANPLKYHQIPHEIGDSLIPEHIRKCKTTDNLLGFINGYDKNKATANLRTGSHENLEQLVDSIKSQFQISDYEKNSSEQEDTDIAKVREFMTEMLLEDLTFLSEIKGIILTLQSNGNYVTVAQKDGRGKLHFVYFPAMKQMAFDFHDKYYVYSTGLFSKLLGSNVAETKPADLSFKESFRKFLGIDTLGGN
jgi:hypothetical protein